LLAADLQPLALHPPKLWSMLQIAIAAASILHPRPFPIWIELAQRMRSFRGGGREGEMANTPTARRRRRRRIGGYTTYFHFVKYFNSQDLRVLQSSHGSICPLVSQVVAAAAITIHIPWTPCTDIWLNGQRLEIRGHEDWAIKGRACGGGERGGREP
jgi:hypothetical protein